MNALTIEKTNEKSARLDKMRNNVIRHLSHLNAKPIIKNLITDGVALYPSVAKSIINELEKVKPFRDGGVKAAYYKMLTSDRPYYMNQFGQYLKH